MRTREVGHLLNRMAEGVSEIEKLALPALLEVLVNDLLLPRGRSLD